MFRASFFFVMGSSLLFSMAQINAQDYGNDSLVNNASSDMSNFKQNEVSFKGFSGHYLLVNENGADTIAKDAVTNQPFYFVFANNSNPNLGNGTFEFPFADLSPLDGALNAQGASLPGNIIYVFSGDGTTTNMSHGITLQNGQRFLGSGVSHQFQTTLGPVVVPALTVASPSITTSTSMPTVNVAVCNEISGFNLTSSGTGSVIATTVATDVGNLNINRNFISFPNAVCVNFNSFGDFLFDSNTLVGAAVFRLPNVSGRAVSSLSATNNLVFNAPGTAGFYLSPDNPFATLDAVLSGNEVYNTAVGINLLGAGTLRAKIFNNNLHDNVNEGIQISGYFATTSIFANCENNQLTHNGTQGYLAHTTIAGAQLCMRLVNNTSIGNVGNAFEVANFTGATLNLEPPANNMGKITTSGTITYVSPCSCNVWE